MDTIEKAAEKLARLGKSTNSGNNFQQREIQPPPPPPPTETAEQRQARIDAQAREVHPLTRHLEENGFLLPEGGSAQQIEEYRRIKRPLLMNVDGKGDKQVKAPNLVMVTSSLAGEGKTYTSINLAVSIAMELDRTVLLVDADVHKPACSALLGIDERYGLTDVLACSDVSVADVLVKTDVPKMSLLSVGRRCENANELLASSKMAKLMEELAQRYNDRVVIIDTPPLLLTNEAAILANLVGQMLVVVEAEKTRQSVLEEALSGIDMENINVGLVLNKGRLSAARSSYYYGGYGYTEKK